MSDATVQAVHDAIAAHIADVNDGAAEYLTEWLFVASTAVAEKAGRTGYYYRDSDLPYHHAIGLLKYGNDALSDFDDADDED